MNMPGPMPTSTSDLRCEQLIEVQATEASPLRQLLIGTVGVMRVVIFGYLDKNDVWHSTIVPPEFREEEILIKLKLDLQFEFGAMLLTVPGDTINQQLSPPPP